MIFQDPIQNTLHVWIKKVYRQQNSKNKKEFSVFIWAYENFCYVTAFRSVEKKSQGKCQNK